MTPCKALPTIAITISGSLENAVPNFNMIPTSCRVVTPSPALEASTSRSASFFCNVKNPPIPGMLAVIRSPPASLTARLRHGMTWENGLSNPTANSAMSASVTSKFSGTFVSKNPGLPALGTLHFWITGMAKKLSPSVTSAGNKARGSNVPTRANTRSRDAAISRAPFQFSYR